VRQQVFDFRPERPRRKTKVLNSRGVIEHEILIHAPRHGGSEMVKGWQQPSAANRSTKNGHRQLYNEPPFSERIKDAPDHFIVAYCFTPGDFIRLCGEMRRLQCLDTGNRQVLCMERLSLPSCGTGDREKNQNE